MIKCINECKTIEELEELGRIKIITTLKVITQDETVFLTGVEWYGVIDGMFKVVGEDDWDGVESKFVIFPAMNVRSVEVEEKEIKGYTDAWDNKFKELYKTEKGEC